MTDVVSKEKRREIMSRVKGKNTRPELIVRSIIHSMGYRFRLHHGDLPGKPDIVLKKHRKIILVNGCFWHGHKNCKKARLPSSNVEFWSEKRRANLARDKDVVKKLKELDWKILIVWECQTKPGRNEWLKHKIDKFLRG